MRFREEGLVEDPGLANTNKAVPTAMHHVVINLLCVWHESMMP